MSNMLAISEAASIAIHLCVRLTQTGPVFYSTRKVAEEFDLSVHHLAKVVQKLVKAGIIESSRGGQGGIRLLKPQDTLSIADLNEAVVEMEKGGCPLNPHVCAGCTCSFGKWIQAENKAIHDSFRQTTIKSIADSLYNDSAQKER